MVVTMSDYQGRIWDLLPYHFRPFCWRAVLEVVRCLLWYIVEQCLITYLPSKSDVIKSIGIFVSSGSNGGVSYGQAEQPSYCTSAISAQLGIMARSTCKVQASDWPIPYVSY